MAKTQPETGDIIREKNQELVQHKKEPQQTPDAQPQQSSAAWLEQGAQDPGQSSPAAILALQAKAGNDEVRRAAAPGAQPDALVDPHGALHRSVSDEIQRARGGGAGLDPALKRQAGENLGFNFDPVRIHADQKADRLSSQLLARAFTIGNDIFFRQGAFNPQSAQGRHTLLHELTHVTQQTPGSGSSGPLKLGEPGDRHEQEAERSARGLANANIAKTDSPVLNGRVQRSLASIGQSMAGLFNRGGGTAPASPPPIPAHPAGTTPSQWNQLQKAGIADKAAWTSLSIDERKGILDALAADTNLAKKLIAAKQNGNWPEDEADAPIYDLNKIRTIDGALLIDFSEWKTKVKPAHRKDLLLHAAAKPSYLRSLSWVALGDKWPKDENDAEITAADRLKTIYDTMKTSFKDWAATDKAHRKVLLGMSAKPYARELVQASVGNAWPKDGSDNAINTEADIEIIREKLGINLARWNTIAKAGQRKFLLANSDKGYIVELANAALAGRWPQDETNDIDSDPALTMIKDKMKLSFTAWSGITVPARKKSLLQSVSGFDDNYLTELASSALSGVWPKDGLDADITEKDKWFLIKKVAQGMSPGQWNVFSLNTRRDALAEADDEKRKNIINAANYERTSEEGALEKAGGVAEHALVDSTTGALGMTSSILSASKGTGDNPDLDRASGIVGAVGDAGNMLASGTSFLGNIAKMRRGKKMSQGENYSRAAKEVGKKEASKGAWGATTSGMGFMGSMFGFGGNVTKAVDPESDGASAASGALGGTGGLFSMVGSTLGMGKSGASLRSGWNRSNKAKNYVKAGTTSAPLTPEQIKMNKIAEFTSKNQNKSGKGLGVAKGAFSAMGGLFSAIGGFAGIASKETGFAMDIASSAMSGLGIVTGLGQWGAEAANKPKDADVEANVTQLIELLRQGDPAGKDAARFTREVLGINFVVLNDPATWVKWIDEDEAAAKALIKSKLTKL